MQDKRRRSESVGEAFAVWSFLMLSSGKSALSSPCGAVGMALVLNLRLFS